MGAGNTIATAYRGNGLTLAYTNSRADANRIEIEYFFSSRLYWWTSHTGERMLWFLWTYHKILTILVTSNNRCEVSENVHIMTVQ